MANLKTSVMEAPSGFKKGERVTFVTGSNDDLVERSGVVQAIERGMRGDYIVIRSEGCTVRVRPARVTRT